MQTEIIESIKMPEYSPKTLKECYQILERTLSKGFVENHRNFYLKGSDYLLPHNRNYFVSLYEIRSMFDDSGGTYFVKEDSFFGYLKRNLKDHGTGGWFAYGISNIIAQFFHIYLAHPEWDEAQLIRAIQKELDREYMKYSGYTFSIEKKYMNNFIKSINKEIRGIVSHYTPRRKKVFKKVIKTCDDAKIKNFWDKTQHVSLPAARCSSKCHWRPFPTRELRSVSDKSVYNFMIPFHRIRMHFYIYRRRGDCTKVTTPPVWVAYAVFHHFLFERKRPARTPYRSVRKLTEGVDEV